MTLIEFLRARLDEDQKAALAAADRAGERWSASAPGLYNESDPSNHPGPFATGAWGDMDDDVADHIARHAPARVLAEVEAKRRIIEWHADGHYCTDLGNLESWYLPDGPCPTLRALAIPHADHPDYDEGWKP